ncbi:MAG: MFS transporter [Candidatus Hydrogenedens sp.]|nr:MFS transporter [Candidatus Hydrogenedens sp.]
MIRMLTKPWRGLGRGPRRFLWFTALNVASWHSLVGPVLVLFAREIGMPPSMVGIMLSFLPVSMALIIFTVPLVERFGPRRLMMVTWLARNIAACLAFSLPWVLWKLPHFVAWYVLAGAVLAFCVTRAFGVGGWFPWLHEMVEEDQRGAFFSAEAAVAQVVIVSLNLVHAVVLYGDPGLYHYLGIYASGVVLGLCSVILMARIPGGDRTPPHERAENLIVLYRSVLADRHFVLFLALSSVGHVVIAAVRTTAVLFLRDDLHFSANLIMAIFTAGSIAVLLSVRSWSRFAEQHGTSLGAVLSLVGHAAVCAAFLFALPGTTWSVPLVAGAMLLGLVLHTAFGVICEHACLDYVQPGARVAYTNIWMLTVALSLGLTPIACGYVIEYGGDLGYRSLFACAGVLALAGAVLARRYIPDLRQHDEALVNLLNPVLTARVFGRIMWVTLGLHPAPSSKAEDS